MRFEVIDSEVIKIEEIQTSTQLAIVSTFVGLLNKTETTRINDTTVEDVNYTFDLDAGDYVEVSRSTRTELVVEPPPTLEQQVSDLQDVVNAILMGGL